METVVLVPRGRDISESQVSLSAQPEQLTVPEGGGGGSVGVGLQFVCTAHLAPYHRDGH